MHRTTTPPLPQRGARGTSGSCGHSGTAARGRMRRPSPAPRIPRSHASRRHRGPCEDQTITPPFSCRPRRSAATCAPIGGRIFRRPLSGAWRIGVETRFRSSLTQRVRTGRLVGRLAGRLFGIGAILNHRGRWGRVWGRALGRVQPYGCTTTVLPVSAPGRGVPTCSHSAALIASSSNSASECRCSSSISLRMRGCAYCGSVNSAPSWF